MEIPDALFEYFEGAPPRDARRVLHLMGLIVADIEARSDQKLTLPPNRKLKLKAADQPVDKTRFPKPDSIPAQVVMILRDHEKPMTVAELQAEMLRRFGREVATTVLRAELYKKSRPENHKLGYDNISRDGEGLFGLQEWQWRERAGSPHDQGDDPTQAGA